MGKRTIGLLWVVLATVGMSGKKTSTLEFNLRVHSLGEGAYVATDKDFYDSNVLVVKMPDGTVVLVSSPFEKRATEVLMKWVNQEVRPSKVVAINPHFHRDGTGGNQVYERFGETWSSDLTKQLRLKANQVSPKDSVSFYQDEALKKRILESPAIPAKHTFPLKEGKRFSFGGEPIEVYFPGPAHSPDNVVVFFPRRKLLFGGCMVKPESLGFLGDASVSAWPASAQNLLRFEVKTVIPGHGPWGGAELIQKTVRVAKKAGTGTP